MKTVIFTVHDFPYGSSAGCNRVWSYCQLLLDMNAEVTVAVYSGSGRTGEEEYRGVKCRRNPAMGSHLKQIWSRFLWARRLLNSLRPEAVLFYGEDSLLLLMLRHWCNHHGAVLVKEENEHPEVRLKTARSRRFFLWANYALPDVVACMTGVLAEWMRSYRSGIRTVSFPMTVDMERFRTAIPEKPGYPYIVYCGILNDHKDGVNLLLSAFARVHAEFPEWRLVLIGGAIPGSPQDMEYYRAFAKECGTAEATVFAGQMKPEQIPGWLRGAEIAVLARPDSLQAKAGFPTKLGEYMAAGAAVIVSDVGEIGQTLRNGSDVLLVAPGDAADLEDALRRLLKDAPLRKTLRENAVETAGTKFNSLRNSGELRNYLSGIVASRKKG